MIRGLAEAGDAAAFGGKAVQLGMAVRAGLPVPAGFAIAVDGVDAVARGERAALADLGAACAGAGLLDRPLAVRSSAVGEDSGAASFAGAHESVLAVCGVDAVVQAVRRVRDSARGPAAVAYRSGLGLPVAAAMAVVVHELVDAQVAGVLFTRNPVTGVAERVIEASWGLGEAVVSGLVTPDSYRLDRRRPAGGDPPRREGRGHPVPARRRYAARRGRRRAGAPAVPGRGGSRRAAHAGRGLRPGLRLPGP